MAKHSRGQLAAEAIDRHHFGTLLPVFHDL
jgi:hypothetical protein